MTHMVYPVELTPDIDDGGYTFTCRDFPEAITQGETKTQALSEAADAIEEAVASRMKRNVDIPEPSRKKNIVNSWSPYRFPHPLKPPCTKRCVTTTSVRVNSPNLCRWKGNPPHA